MCLFRCPLFLCDLTCCVPFLSLVGAQLLGVKCLVLDVEKHVIGMVEFWAYVHTIGEVVALTAGLSK